jgi:hypothetical protein
MRMSLSCTRHSAPRSAVLATFTTAAIFCGTALAQATDLPVKPAVAVTKPAPAVVEQAPPIPRARPAAIRLPAVVWTPRRSSSWVRIVSAIPPVSRPSWSYYAIVHGVGF